MASQGGRQSLPSERFILPTLGDEVADEVGALLCGTGNEI